MKELDKTSDGNHIVRMTDDEYLSFTDSRKRIEALRARRKFADPEAISRMQVQLLKILGISDLRVRRIIIDVQLNDITVYPILTGEVEGIEKLADVIALAVQEDMMKVEKPCEQADVEDTKDEQEK